MESLSMIQMIRFIRLTSEYIQSSLVFSTKILAISMSILGIIAIFISELLYIGLTVFFFMEGIKGIKTRKLLLIGRWISFKIEGEKALYFGVFYVVFGLICSLLFINQEIIGTLKFLKQ